MNLLNFATSFQIWQVTSINERNKMETGNKQQATGNRQQATGNKQQATSWQATRKKLS
jgi:hypothetical protein